ncbi:MAG: type II toxin-antitoxin system VapC family toxin [Bacteroidales bacterium]|nr:type II toxin-antitoxin system VapC family toxin [Bacteroidales bacterium]
MARYMLDTNIFAFYVEEEDRLSQDVYAILEDYGNKLYMSSESIKELVWIHRNKNVLRKTWKTPLEMINAIEDEYRISIVPVDVNVLKRMSQLEPNTAESHNDPSDLIIIAHSMVMKMPLISSDRKFPFYRNQGLDLITNFVE